MVVDISSWKEILFDDNKPIIYSLDNSQELVLMSYEKYRDYLDKIAALDKGLQNSFILHMGNQLLDWDDGSAAIYEAANAMDIEIDLANALTSYLYGSIFRDTDMECASFSYQGWEVYEALKGKNEELEEEED